MNGFFVSLDNIYLSKLLNIKLFYIMKFNVEIKLTFLLNTKYLFEFNTLKLSLLSAPSTSVMEIVYFVKKIINNKM